LAVGRSAAGIDGFRRTHGEAREAARIARLAPGVASGLTLYASVELVSLLAADLERARVFVQRELGALAAIDDQTERVRETLYVYLDEGMNRPRAAQRLHVHGNTVSYRVARAVDLLDAPIEGRRTSVAAALMLARLLGETVLTHS
jgi:DNA-binding PucR family transcriptional regulator